jgi:predicted O-methyltransferase YrrM
MDSSALDVLHEYEQRARQEASRAEKMTWESFVEHRDEFLLSVGPATGQLLNILAAESAAQSMLEIGTSYGYSTLWLADAARKTGGKVITLDLHEDKQSYARSQLQKAKLDSFVDFRSGDARELIAAMNQTFDLVLLDLWKNLYIPCFDLFYPKLARGAIIVADNMTYPESARGHAEDYRKHVRARPDIDSVLLPVGSGLELSRRA